MKFLNKIVILFLHSCRLPCEMKSHHGLMICNFIPGLKSRYKQSLRRRFFAKMVDHFCKRLHLRCLTGFWMRLCCVRDNYLFVKFLIQPYLLHFLDFSGDSKLRLFQLFRFSINSYICTTIGNKILLIKSSVTSSDLFLHNWGKLL